MWFDEPWWTHKQLLGCKLHKWKHIIILKPSIVANNLDRIGEYRYCINCGEQTKIDSTSSWAGIDFGKVDAITFEYIKKHPI